MLLALLVGGFFSVMGAISERPWFSGFVPYRRWQGRAAAFVTLQILLLAAVTIGQLLSSLPAKSDVGWAILTEITLYLSFVITVLTIWWIVPIEITTLSFETMCV